MPAQLNHTIVHARDAHASAEFLAQILGLPAPRRLYHFWVVEAANGVSLDFLSSDEDIQIAHYAFLVSEQEFDEIFQRIERRQLPYWADPGQAVLAPCTGVVVARRDGLTDRPPLAPAVSKNLAGNFPGLHCDEQDVTVLLAHLQPGLLASEGDAVQVGKALARVGNSGNSSEPHLHIHALRGSVTDHETLIGTGAGGLSMSFDDRGGLSRGDFLPPAR